jgi:hypothetical protein
MEQQAIYTFTSHIQGKNAKIMIYPDRVEWDRPRGISSGKVTAGVLTLGLSTLATGVKGGKASTEMIPVKSISSVTTKRDGFSNTIVQVITTGNTVDFRVSHKEAAAVKEVLTQLIVGSHPSQQVAPAAAPAYAAPPAEPAPAAPAADVPAQLQQLAGLHAAGILSDGEFATKKAELLARM